MVVVAIGSRLMKDDAIGVRVAEHIQKNLSNHGIKVVIAETDIDYGLAATTRDNHVIVLDAFCSGKRPSEITVLSLREIENEETMPVSQHEQNLIDFIKQSNKIKGCLIGIEAADISYGLELSVHLQIMFNDICSRVEQTILHEQYK